MTYKNYIALALRMFGFWLVLQVAHMLITTISLLFAVKGNSGADLLSPLDLHYYLVPLIYLIIQLVIAVSFIFIPKLFVRIFVSGIDSSDMPLPKDANKIYELYLIALRFLGIFIFVNSLKFLSESIPYLTLAETNPYNSPFIIPLTVQFLVATILVFKAKWLAKFIEKIDK